MIDVGFVGGSGLGMPCRRLSPGYAVSSPRVRRHARARQDRDLSQQDRDLCTWMMLQHEPSATIAILSRQDRDLMPSIPYADEGESRAHDHL